MSQLERLQKLHNKHMTVDKTYPPYIEYKNVVVGRTAINPINFNDMKNKIVRLEMIDKTRSPPSIYKNNEEERYYIQYVYTGYQYSKNLFDITDNYDWDKVMQERILKKEFMTKEYKHIVPTLEDKIYYPGSVEYDRVYPPH
jgi:hypothetical protein